MKSGSIDLTILQWEGIQGGLVRYTLDRKVCGLNPIKHASMSTLQEIGKYKTSGVNIKDDVPSLGSRIIMFCNTCVYAKNCQ